MRYKNVIKYKTCLRVNTSVEGETIEQKVFRVMRSEGGITDGAPLIYQERAEGVAAGHDIRTDRWEIAQDAKDLISRVEVAKRTQKPVVEKDVEVSNSESADTNSKPKE